MQHNSPRSPKRPFSRLQILCIGFGLLCALYLFSRLGLMSQADELAREYQNLASQVAQTENEIEDLQNEITLLQDKNRVLGMLDDQVSDNKDNVYVIEKSDN